MWMTRALPGQFCTRLIAALLVVLAFVSVFSNSSAAGLQSGGMAVQAQAVYGYDASVDVAQSHTTRLAPSVPTAVLFQYFGTFR